MAIVMAPTRVKKKGVKRTSTGPMQVAQKIEL